MSVQNLKPTIDEIKRLYGDDQKRVQKETSVLYEKSGVNPLAGALVMHALLPPMHPRYPSVTGRYVFSQAHLHALTGHSTPHLHRLRLMLPSCMDDALEFRACKGEGTHAVGASS